MVVMMYCQRHQWRLTLLKSDSYYFSISNIHGEYLNEFVGSGRRDIVSDNDDTGTGHHTAHRSAINPRGLLDIAGHLFRDKIGVICKYRG
jgi:hypothetical protein